MRALFLVCAVSAALTLVGSAGATGTLDQSQTVFGYSTNIGELSLGVTSHAQTITAGITGSLAQVDLIIKRTWALGNVVVEVRTLSEGLPSTTVLGHGLLLGTDVPLVSPENQWVSVPLSAPAHVLAGNQYAIVLTAYHGNFQILDMADFNDGQDFYPGGRELFQSEISMHGWTWVALPRPSDMAFKTYVTPFH